MRHTSTIFRIICLIVIIVLLAGCLSPSTKLRLALYDYEKMIQGDIPEDLRLTIYYIDPQILTLYALGIDDLINFHDVEKIVVEREELVSNLELFRKLNSAILITSENEPRINARLYYVLESSESGKLLEVVISEVHGDIVVNGMGVEHNSLFYELIWPFLTEDARAMYS